MDIHELSKAINQNKDKIAVVLPDNKVLVVDKSIFCMQDDGIILMIKELPCRITDKTYCKTCGDIKSHLCVTH